jgi:hypothetical protein
MSQKKNHIFRFIILIKTLTILFFTLSCAQFIQTAHRPELQNQVSEESQNHTTKNDTSDLLKTEMTLSDKELEKYAYELGFDPKKSLTNEEKKQILDRKKLRNLERKLDSAKERLNYSKILPLLKNDEEKLNYLSIDSIEGKQSWVNRHKIWSREKENPDFLQLVEKQDITLGMTQENVRRAWGEPQIIEASGNPIYRNERWKYAKETPTLSGYKKERRYVYFEGGRVVGWETE